MLGKLPIFGAVAGFLIIPTALSAQMGGAVNPGVGALFVSRVGSRRLEKIL